MCYSLYFSDEISALVEYTWRHLATNTCTLKLQIRLANRINFNFSTTDYFCHCVSTCSAYFITGIVFIISFSEPVFFPFCVCTWYVGSSSGNGNLPMCHWMIKFYFIQGGEKIEFWSRHVPDQDKRVIANIRLCTSELGF